MVSFAVVEVGDGCFAFFAGGTMPGAEDGEDILIGFLAGGTVCGLGTAASEMLSIWSNSDDNNTS